MRVARVDGQRLVNGVERQLLMAHRGEDTGEVAEGVAAMRKPRGNLVVLAERGAHVPHSEVRPGEALPEIVIIRCQRERLVQHGDGLRRLVLRHQGDAALVEHATALPKRLAGGQPTIGAASSRWR